MSASPSAGPPSAAGPWRGVHRALTDPLRIRLFEALWREPRSAKELSARLGLPADRLYYHLRQLERAGIIEVGEYRPLPGGKVERVYRRVRAEPPQDASPQETAVFLGSVLDATKADVTAAFLAKEEGQRREVFVGRGPLRLTDTDLAEFHAKLRDLEQRCANQDPDAEGTWVSAVVVLVDLEERPPAAARPHRPRKEGP